MLARLIRLSAIALFLATSATANDGHLLICEVVLTPTEAEYIEIHNPTSIAVDLTNYYLSDSNAYATTPLGFEKIMGGDFIARFPAGTSIGAGATLVVALSASGYCLGYFPDTECVLPAFELPSASNHPDVPNMLSAYGGSIPFGPSLANGGEAVYLFFYDGTSDLIKDVDMVRTGQPDQFNGDDLAGKTNLSIDGNGDGTFSTYADDGMLMPTMSVTAGTGFSHKRIYFAGATEVVCGNSGNGITGHDETNEDIRFSWDGTLTPLTAPTPGACGPFTNPPIDCVGDIAPAMPDNVVNVGDLLALISDWGPCDVCADCPADLCVNCVVNVGDLLALIAHWGPCGG